MKRDDVLEIREHFKGDRIVFDYFKGRYALILLDMILNEGMKVRDLRSSPLSSLLHKPGVKEVMASCGNGILYRHDLYPIWSEDHMAFRVTVDSYDGWSQKTRAGANVVVQLNFSNKHNRALHALLRPQDQKKPFGYYRYHPNRQDHEHTLAWARIDLDRNSDMALIEEIQTDWIRNAMWYRMKEVEVTSGGKGTRKAWDINGAICLKGEIDTYISRVLKPYIGIWSEAMLACTIWFLRRKLGVKEIFYHTHESGALLKGIQGRQPPRSLYTDLPKKFCFKKTTELPDFLEKSLRNRWKDAVRKGYRLNKLSI